MWPKCAFGDQKDLIRNKDMPFSNSVPTSKADNVFGQHTVVVGLISAGLVCKSTRHDRDIARCVGIMHHAMHLVQWHDRGQGGWWRQWNAWGVAVLRMPDPEADSTVEGAAKGPAEAEGRGGGLARMLTSPWNTSDEVELAAACSTQKDVCWIWRVPDFDAALICCLWMGRHSDAAS